MKKEISYLAYLCEETQFPIFDFLDWYEHEACYLNEEDLKLVLESIGGMLGGLAGMGLGSLAGPMGAAAGATIGYNLGNAGEKSFNSRGTLAQRKKNEEQVTRNNAYLALDKLYNLYSYKGGLSEDEKKFALMIRSIGQILKLPINDPKAHAIYKSEDESESKPKPATATTTTNASNATHDPEEMKNYFGVPGNDHNPYISR